MKKFTIYVSVDVVTLLITFISNI